MISRAVRWPLAVALFLVLVFFGCQLAGLRETTSLLSRIDLITKPSRSELFGFGLYLASYLGFVLVAPVLSIAAGLLFASAKVVNRRIDPS